MINDDVAGVAAEDDLRVKASQRGLHWFEHDREEDQNDVSQWRSARGGSSPGFRMRTESDVIWQYKSYVYLDGIQIPRKSELWIRSRNQNWNPLRFRLKL